MITNYPFNIKLTDNNFCVYNCPKEWYVNEPGTPFHRIYYVYDGLAIYEDGEKVIPLEKNYIYIFPVNKAYKINHDQRNPFKCLWFSVHLSPMILNSIISYNINGNSMASHQFKALEFAMEQKKKSTEENVLINTMLLNLLLIISESEKFKYLSDNNINLVIDHIKDNYLDNITNDDLASMVGYDTSYFIRYFKKCVGISPQKYISKYRLDKAAILLKDNLLVEEVSEKVGYTDVKAFCRAFKKEKSFSPSEYKKVNFSNL